MTASRRTTGVHDHGRRKVSVMLRTVLRAVTILLSASPAVADLSTAPSHQNRDHRMTMQTDLADRERAIHWPSGFNPEKADLFAHNALRIDAPCEIVWGHIVDAASWPRWYPNATNVKLLDGATRLGAATAWRWTTFGIDIESRVHEFEPFTRLGWYGYAPGKAPSFYHAWHLTPRGSGCLVAMDEVGIGEDAAKLREADEGLMHRGHDLWLAGLKWISEAGR